MSHRGTLYLIAGPSGAGKDTLLVEARKRLSGTHVFPRRIVTRTPGNNAEDHADTTAEAFAEACKRGEFAFFWSAHGFSYAIPTSIWKDLDEGRHVVINVARAIAASARQSITPSRIILVTARREILAQRLAARGRETAHNIEQRLDRAVDLAPDTLVENEEGLDAAVSRFLAALQG